jgi:hypothetical protein
VQVKHALMLLVQHNYVNVYSRGMGEDAWGPHANANRPATFVYQLDVEAVLNIIRQAQASCVSAGLSSAVCCWAAAVCEESPARMRKVCEESQARIRKVCEESQARMGKVCEESQARMGKVCEESQARMGKVCEESQARIR